jgi:hypothetical protein
MTSSRRIIVLVAGLVISTAAPLCARHGDPPDGTAPVPARHQVISANPFGLLVDWFNVEIERKVSRSTTAGIGGSYLTDEGDEYVNADVFYRYYPAGRAFEGWAFGVKVGMTNVDGASHVGVGFDVNWSWLPGPHDRFYLGAGFGLKRLFGTDDNVMSLVPTIRIINVGVAF